MLFVYILKVRKLCKMKICFTFSVFPSGTAAEKTFTLIVTSDDS